MSPARLFLFLLSLEFIQIFFSHFFLIFPKTGNAVSCLFNDSSHVHRRGRRVIYSFNPPRSALSGCKRRSGMIRPGSRTSRMSMNVVNERIKVNLSNWMKDFIQFPMKFVQGQRLLKVKYVLSGPFLATTRVLRTSHFKCGLKSLSTQLK